MLLSVQIISFTAFAELNSIQESVEERNENFVLAFNSA